MALVIPTLVSHIFLHWQAPLNKPVPCAPSWAVAELACLLVTALDLSALVLSYPFLASPRSVGHLWYSRALLLFQAFHCSLAIYFQLRPFVSDVCISIYINTWIYVCINFFLMTVANLGKPLFKKFVIKRSWPRFCCSSLFMAMLNLCVCSLYLAIRLK